MERKEFVLSIGLGVLLSLTVSFVLILLYSLVLCFLPMEQTTIKVINQFIKVISVFIGVMAFTRESKGFIKGSIIATVYTLLFYLLFTVFGHNIFSIGFLFDIIIHGILGGIFGIFFVNKIK